MLKARTIISFLFLAIFLFAWGSKTVHVLVEDHEEVVCKETQHHFHEGEEKCFICEFDLQTTDGAVYAYGEWRVHNGEFAKVNVFESFVLVKQSFSFDSRGPPALA